MFVVKSPFGTHVITNSHAAATIAVKHLSRRYSGLYIVAVNA